MALVPVERKYINTKEANHISPNFFSCHVPTPSIALMFPAAGAYIPASRDVCGQVILSLVKRKLYPQPTETPTGARRLSWMSYPFPTLSSSLRFPVGSFAGQAGKDGAPAKLEPVCMQYRIRTHPYRDVCATRRRPEGSAAAHAMVRKESLRFAVCAARLIRRGEHALTLKTGTKQKGPRQAGGLFQS